MLDERKCLILICLLLSMLPLGACSIAKQEAKEAKAAAVAEPTRTPAKTETVKVLTNRPATVAARNGIKLFTEANPASVEIKTLRDNSVVMVLDEIELPSTGHWYRIKTASGADGWAQGSLQFCSIQESQHLIAMDKEALEDRLRELILQAAVKEVEAKNPHPMSSLESKTITAQLTPDDVESNSYSVTVACLMKGKILGKSIFRLDVKVDLFLEIDKDAFASSEVRVKGAAITSDQAIAQMPITEQMSLLRLVLPIL